MNCVEVQEYMFAFLDSELDAPLSIELQRHLDRCPECAREAEIERTIGRQLVTAVCLAPAGIPSLEESASSFLGGAERGETQVNRLPGRSSWRYAAAAAIVLAVGAGSWFLIPRSPDAHGPSRFADLVVGDLEHFLEEGRPLQIASADPVEVASWLYAKTELPVSLPALHDCPFELHGGRKCKIDGRPAAFAIYDADGTPVSLVVVAETANMLDGMTRVRQAGRFHWVERCKGHTVLARRRGSLVYAATSTLSERDLLCLMTETIHEGD